MLYMVAFQRCESSGQKENELIHRDPISPTTPFTCDLNMEATDSDQLEAQPQPQQEAQLQPESSQSQSQSGRRSWTPELHLLFWMPWVNLEVWKVRTFESN